HTHRRKREAYADHNGSQPTGHRCLSVQRKGAGATSRSADLPRLVEAPAIRASTRRHAASVIRWSARADAGESQAARDRHRHGAVRRRPGAELAVVIPAPAIGDATGREPASVLVTLVQ